MKTHIHGKIRGKVQGVCFRDATRDFAQSKGISGIVRNEPDGSVYVEAEGDEQQLESLRAWLWRGPPLAEVKAVDLREDELRNYVGFTVEA